MRQDTPPIIRTYARKMRRDATLAENILWQAIRNNQLGGLKFKRQAPLLGYIVDFACFRSRLIIELDGSQHSGSNSDVERDKCLNASSFKTLRFWNDEIIRNLDGVCSQILHEANKRRSGVHIPLSGDF
ncbi:endonuclease domain-containing protein [Phyllobacterium sophorae]|uniref:DUF559 domain-containing protein n=1 Tax=Phyllobacterium sophorae TaxID=1520277 RepID=A0A2P7B4H1_9HYPH|nr:DUF559 domain-containing protein [Phyllobacterium sophorae]PSH61348.1 hypothetical protein CU103_23580 [Phyllobacterium sophorae]